MDTSGAIKDLIAFKAPAHVIEAARKRAEEDGKFEVFEDCADALEFFLRVSTQWVLGPMGGLVGLNYASVESAFRIYGIERKKRGEMLDDIREIEMGALEAVAREKKG